MILVIGSAASGKREYVKSLGFSERDISPALAEDKPVLCDLQDLVAQDPDRAMELAEELLKKQVVICNEVGSGVIPIDHRERQAREQTGRLCIRLAQQAERVVRLVCGIPTVLKERP